MILLVRCHLACKNSADAVLWGFSGESMWGVLCEYSCEVYCVSTHVRCTVWVCEVYCVSTHVRCTVWVCEVYCVSTHVRCAVWACEVYCVSMWGVLCEYVRCTVWVLMWGVLCEYVRCTVWVLMWGVLCEYVRCAVWACEVYCVSMWGVLCEYSCEVCCVSMWGVLCEHVRCIVWVCKVYCVSTWGVLVAGGGAGDEGEEGDWRDDETWAAVVWCWQREETDDGRGCKIRTTVVSDEQRKTEGILLDNCRLVSGRGITIRYKERMQFRLIAVLQQTAFHVVSVHFTTTVKKQLCTTCI